MMHLFSFIYLVTLLTAEQNTCHFRHIKTQTKYRVWLVQFASRDPCKCSGTVHFTHSSKTVLSAARVCLVFVEWCPWTEKRCSIKLS
jgi:hypothetical protein